MKKLFVLFLLVASSFAVKAQSNPFPTTDSLERFINIWIRNTASTAFTNLRLNTALIGMTRFIDSTYGRQLNTAYAKNDSTLVLKLLNGDSINVVIKGGAGGSGGSDGYVDDVTYSQSLRILTFEQPGHADITLTLPLVTTTLPGLMSATDKVKLDSAIVARVILNDSVTCYYRKDGSLVGCDTARALIASKSLNAATANSIELDNDEESPGANEAYSTNGSGVKGWYPITSGAPSLTTTRLGFGTGGLLDATGSQYLTWTNATNLLSNRHLQFTQDTSSALHKMIFIEGDTSVPNFTFALNHTFSNPDFPNQPNPVFAIGFNMDGSKPWYPMFRDAWEFRYQNFPGDQRYVERHVGEFTPAGGGSALRPITFGYGWDGLAGYIQMKGDAFTFLNIANNPIFSMGASGSATLEGTGVTMKVKSSGAIGGFDSDYRILGTNDGTGLTHIINYGTGSSPYLQTSSPGFLFASSAANAGASDFYFNSGHAGTSGYNFSILKQSVQKFTVASSGQTIVGVDVLGGGTNYTNYQFQAGGTSLMYDGLKIGGTAGGAVKDSKAILDIESTTKYVLLPRMTTAQMLTIASPADGAMIYLPDSGDVFVYKASAWFRAGGGLGGGGMITSLNGLISTTQTFATPATGGTAPNWSSSVSTHTLNIPMASSSGTTAGLLSYVDHTLFNNWYTGKAGGNTLKGGANNGDGLVIQATASGAGGITLLPSGSAGLLIDELGGRLRAYSGQGLTIQTNISGSGDGFTFYNGTTSATGNIFRIRTSESGDIGATQRAFTVWGNNDTENFSIQAGGNIYVGKTRAHGTPYSVLLKGTDSLLIQTTSVPVALGGTGRSTATAYGLIAGGTTSTGAQQSVGTGSTGNILVSNGASSLPTFQDLLQYGTWAPSLFNTTNVAGTSATGKFTRVGDVVTFSIQVTVDPTATGLVELGISLPVASAFVADTDATGTATSSGSTDKVAIVKADGANDRLLLSYTCADITAQIFYITGQYTILTP